MAARLKTEEGRAACRKRQCIDQLTRAFQDLGHMASPPLGVDIPQGRPWTSRRSRRSCRVEVASGLNRHTHPRWGEWLAERFELRLDWVMPQPEPAPGVDTLFATLYPELRRMAHARLRGNLRSGLLDTTALVHESYEKLAARADGFADRSHFLAYASRVMRSVLVDLAREQMADKRGGDAVHVTLTTALGSALADERPEVLRVHEALEELAAIDPRLAQIVELRYFGGLENSEIAGVLDVSLRTVERGWEKARLFLFASLNGD